MNFCSMISSKRSKFFSIPGIVLRKYVKLCRTLWIYPAKPAYGCVSAKIASFSHFIAPSINLPINIMLTKIIISYNSTQISFSLHCYFDLRSFRIIQDLLSFTQFPIFSPSTITPFHHPTILSNHVCFLHPWHHRPATPVKQSSFHLYNKSLVPRP